MRALLLSLACCLGLIASATAAVTVVSGAADSNGVSTAGGAELPIGNLVRVGHFTISDSDIQAHVDDLDYLDGHFVAFGTAKIGDQFNAPGHWEKLSNNANSDSLGLAGQQIHFWIFRATNNGSVAETLASASEHGVFYADKNSAQNWRFPANSDIPNTTSVDLSNLTNPAANQLAPAARIVIGTFPNGTSSATHAPNFGLTRIVTGIPTCQTTAATDIGATTATLHATVNPQGHPTSVTFSRGSTALGSVSAGDGITNVKVELAVSGLDPETAYRVTSRAVNSVGAANGGAVNFVTANADRTGSPLVSSSVEARSGAKVPGEGVNTTYANFGIPSIQGPGFLATVNTPAQTYRAIFAGEPAARQVTTGGTIPGSSTLTFAAFLEPVFADATHFAFEARLTPATAGLNDRAVFSNCFGSLRMLARTNALVPGLDGVRYERFVSLALPSANGAVFLARFRQDVGGVTTGNNFALFQEKADGVHMVLRTGSKLEAGGEMRRIKALRFLQAVPGSPGHGRYDAATGSVYGSVAFKDGAEALVALAPDGTVSVVLASGEDRAGVKSAKFGAPDALTTAPSPVVRVTLDPAMGGVSTANDSAVLGVPDGPILAREGTALAGSTTLFYKSFKDPVAGVLGASQALAFIGKLRLGGAVTENNDQALWWQPDSSTAAIAVLARENAVAPETGGGRFAVLQAVSYGPNRGPVFTATLKVGSGKVTAASAAGVWAVDSLGQLRCLLRTNDAVNAGGSVRRVSGFTLLKAVTGSPGQERSIANGAVLVRVNFSDTSSALLKILVP